MITTLMKKELAGYLTDARFLACTLLMIMLFTLSAILGISEFKMLRELGSGGATPLTTAQIQRDSVQNIWIWIHYGTWNQHRPMQYAQILVNGNETGADRVADISFKRLPWYGGDALQNPLTLMFKRPDFIFLIGTLLTLLVFMLSYNAVSGETENNTLLLLLASPISRGELICGKWIGGLIALLIPYLISLIAVLIVLMLHPSISPTLPDLIRVALIFLAGAMYLTVVYALSIAVSVLTGSSTVSIIVLLVIWSGTVMAIPSLAPRIAHMAHTRMSIEEAQTRATHAAITEYGENINRVYKRYGIGIGGPQISPAQQVLFEIDQTNLFKQGQEKVLTLDRKMLAQEERINATATWINRLSPFGCFQNLTLALGHTGFANERALNKANHAYVTDLLAFATEKSQTGARIADMNRGRPVYLAPVPRLKDDLREAAFDAVFLMMYGVLFFMAGYGAFARKNVAG